MNVLSERWGKPVRQIMAELGLFISQDKPIFSEEEVQEYRVKFGRTPLRN